MSGLSQYGLCLVGEDVEGNISLTFSLICTFRVGVLSELRGKVMDEVDVPIIPLTCNSTIGTMSGFSPMSIVRGLEVAERLVRDTSIKSRGGEIDWKDESASPQSFRGNECTLKALLSEEFDKSNSTEAQRRERICSTRGELGSTESVSTLRPSLVNGGVRAIGDGVFVGEFVDGKVSK